MSHSTLLFLPRTLSDETLSAFLISSPGFFHFEIPITDYSSLSYHKPTWQSSFIEGAAPGKADGNQSLHFRSASCARTALEASPWWIVDLQSEYEITHVVITNNEGTLVSANNPSNTTKKKFWFGHLFPRAPYRNTIHF